MINNDKFIYRVRIIGQSDRLVPLMYDQRSIRSSRSPIINSYYLPDSNCLTLLTFNIHTRLLLQRIEYLKFTHCLFQFAQFPSKNSAHTGSSFLFLLLQILTKRFLTFIVHPIETRVIFARTNSGEFAP